MLKKVVSLGIENETGSRLLFLLISPLKRPLTFTAFEFVSEDISLLFDSTETGERSSHNTLTTDLVSMLTE